MAKILFWNVNRKPLSKLIRLLADEHEPDIIILAECEIDTITLLTDLNNASSLTYKIPTNLSSKLIFLSRLPSKYFHSILDEGGISIRKIKFPLEEELLLVGLHLTSKLRADDDEQSFLATRLRNLIENAEKKAKHCRTIVIGDLNMDPFEKGVIGSEALHAVMDKNIATKITRTVYGEERNFFYNPMWGRMGDTTAGPPGTYYYQTSSPTAYFWHTFDQVMIRPDLLHRFTNDSVHVLTSAKNTPLINASGHPDSKNASDHLPLFFKI